MHKIKILSWAWAHGTIGDRQSTIPELANSIENAIAIAFLSTIAIAIDKAIFQLLLLLLLLIRASSNY